MGPDRSRNLQIRFTLRHALVLIAYLALLFKVILPAFEIAGHKGGWNLVLPTLLVTPPLLALLVVFIGRAGPLKNWAVSFLLFLFFPALALNHDGTALLDYVRHGRTPTPWATLLLNVAAFAYVLTHVGRMIPRPCPGCRRRALIPLMQLYKTEQRSSNTCWCASCGGKYWKDREGNWRVERWTTWLDRRKESPALRGMKASPGGRVAISQHDERVPGAETGVPQPG